MSYARRSRAPRQAKTPLEKAADTRRVGLIFLLSVAPMAVASLIAALASGQSAAAITTAP